MFELFIDWDMAAFRPGQVCVEAHGFGGGAGHGFCFRLLEPRSGVRDVPSVAGDAEPVMPAGSAGLGLWVGAADGEDDVCLEHLIVFVVVGDVFRVHR